MGHEEADMTSWEQTFAGLRASYLAGLEAKAENLARALERGDWPGVDRLAHDLRGSGGTYGFPEISQQAQAAEEATPVRKGLLAEALLQEVRRTLGRRDGGEYRSVTGGRKALFSAVGTRTSCPAG